MATNLPSCFPIQFLEQLLKFLVNFTLLKYVNNGFLVTKELIFGFQILDLKDHFSASLILGMFPTFIFLVFILCKSESPIKITLIRLEFSSGSVGGSGVVGLLLDLFRGSDLGIAPAWSASCIDVVVTLSTIMEHSWLDSSGIL